LFKIDKSSVEYLEPNRFFVIVPPAPPAAPEPEIPGPEVSEPAAPEPEVPEPEASEPAVPEPAAPEAAVSDAAASAPPVSETAAPEPPEPETEAETAGLPEEPAESAEPVEQITASSILDEARYEAHCIITDAHERAEQIKADAFQKGYAQGLAELSAQKETNRLEFERLMTSVLQQVTGYIEKSNAAFEQDVLRLSFAIAKKVVYTEFDNKRALFEQLLMRTIRLNLSDNKFLIRVHPDQYAQYFQDGSDWLRNALGCAPFKVVADATFPPYGLVMETDEGDFRAGLDIQFEKLRAALGVIEAADE